ncbi:MAG: VOC family protein [Mycobacteriaceae bacterium]|nr:VOC family protein [Mycobacteriaceae bacterium]
MIDHIGISCADYPESQLFYDTVLSALGFSRQRNFGPDSPTSLRSRWKPSFWIADGSAMGSNREAHIAFQAADEDAVRAFHEAAVGLGAESLHAPRQWPEYHAGYFCAFVRDPDGNNVEAVCRRAKA